MRSILFFIFGLQVACEALAKEVKKEVVLSKGSTSGLFETFIWGDYPYLEIREKEKKVVFFADEGSWSVLEENSEKLKGIEINVSWIKVKKNIPEAGGEVELTKTKYLCSYKKIDLVSLRQEVLPLCK